MNRLLVVRCPDLLDEDEGGVAAPVLRRGGRRPSRPTARGSPPCGPGVCSLPARGPARYFGGEGSLVRLVAEAASTITPVEVGVADGLFAAVLAARRAGVIVPAGGTPAFLAPLPGGRPRPARAGRAADRLGIRTLGEFAALPESHVLGRFGADGVLCHRVAGGRSGELADRAPAGRPADRRRRRGRRRPGRRARVLGRGERHRRPGRPGPGRRAGPPRPRRGGDRPPAGRAGAGPAGPLRHLDRPGGATSDATLGAPWPGQIPPPAPAIVYPAPLPAELADADGDPVAVSGRGLLTATPGRLSVDRGPWTAVTAWAGPWPSDERWWSRSRRQERPHAGGHRGRAPICCWSNGAGGGSKPPTGDGPVRAMPYAELHTHSNFSFLDGASHPEELAAEAARLGLSALALTDHNGLYGVVRFAEAARAFGLPTVFGAELTITGVGVAPTRTGMPDPDGTHLVVLARDPEGYARLSRVIAEAHLAGGEKGKPIITLDALADRHGGHWQVLTGCRKGALAAALTADGPAAAAQTLDQLIGRFGRDHLAVELWDHGNPIDTTRNDALAVLATERGVAPVATNNVHYATPARFPLATALAAVRARRTLGDLEGWLPSSATACLRGEAEQRRRFARWPGVVERAAELGRRVRVRPPPGGAASPRLPGARRAHRADLAGRAGPPGRHRPVRAPGGRAGARGVGPARPRAGHHRRARVPRLLPHRVGHRRLLPAPGHLLPGPGLGGHLGGLLRPRHHQRRRRRPRAALRALPLPGPRRAAGHRRRHRVGPTRGGHPVRLRALRPAARRPGGQRHHLPVPLGAPRRGQGARTRRRGGRRLVQVGRPRASRSTERADLPPLVRDLATDLLDFPRHLGIHSGGMVICDRPVVEVCPVEWGRMPGRSVLQWDKDDCAAAGLVKFDLLGLGMLDRAAPHGRPGPRVPPRGRSTWPISPGAEPSTTCCAGPTPSGCSR